MPSSLCSSSYAQQAADSRYAMGSPCGLLTRSYICCCMPIFVFPPPCRVGFDGGQDAMTHRRRGFVQPVLPDSPVIFSAVPTSETQRASRGKDRLLSVRRRRTPALPRLISACPLPFGTGHTCPPVPAKPSWRRRVDPRFCFQLPSGVHHCTTLLTGVASAKRVAFSYPSPPSGWVWTLPGMRVITPDITISQPGQARHTTNQ
jgi:hypothetical protein